MSPETHQRVRKLFDEALERPEAERMPFLQAACVDNSEVFRQVAQLLGAHAQAAQFAEAEPASPQRIGRYLIAGELGRGAMGIVYQAVDPLIGRKVAIKVIRLQALADGSEAAFLRDRLFREARAAGGLFHPGIVVILDVGQEGDVAFIAMEYVDGPSLFQVMAERPKLDRAEALRILRQTAAALDFAHGHGVVHRDIKPANIMLEKGVTVKVADFGIAKIVSSQQYTQTGVTMGTPSYMSPEQVDAKPLDGRSDQFSLACVAYELLTGAKPFVADSFTALAHTIVYGPVPSAHKVNHELPARVDPVFSRGLAKLPEERYASCRDFMAALERALTGRLSHAEDATPIPMPIERTASAVRKAGASSRYIIIGGAVAAAVLTAAVLGYVWLTRTRSTTSVTNAPVVEHPSKPPAAAPVIARFVADPASIEPGGQVTLNWAVSGAAEVSIEPGIGKKPAASSAAVKPDKSTRYELTAANSAGTAHGEVLVEVKAQAEVLYRQGEAKRHAKQFAEGLALLRRAGDLGYARAMLALGEIYSQDGEGHIHDEQEAMRWYRKAAEAGDRDGMLNVGGFYDAGIGAPESDELAVEWYRRAADRGSPQATYDLARKYESGRGVPRDLARACELYQRSARMGDSDAKNRLAHSGCR
jgi:serine/threonine-protein kinase